MNINKKSKANQNIASTHKNTKKEASVKSSNLGQGKVKGLKKEEVVLMHSRVVSELKTRFLEKNFTEDADLKKLPYTMSEAHMKSLLKGKFEFIWEPWKPKL